MIRAFIFDLDGTLLDSEILWCKAMQQLLVSRGLPCTDAYACELVFGRAWSDIWARLQLDYPSMKEDAETLELESINYYQALRGATDIRIHSSIALLEKLSQRHPVAIVSGSTRRQVSDAITLMGVGERLQFYLGSEDYPRGKPDPACFLLAAKRFGIDPAECLVFEDSSAGVSAAKAAGMHCVALCRPGHPHQNLSGADNILADLADWRPPSI